MTLPGIEPGLLRPQRNVLTTRRCGLLPEAILTSSNDRKQNTQKGALLGKHSRTSCSGPAPQLSVRISKAAVNAIIKGAIAIYAIVAI